MTRPSDSIKIILIAAVFISTLFTRIFAQQPTIEVLELSIERIEAIQTDLNKNIQKLKESIQKNDTEIQIIKDSENIGYLERQRLEGLLKESHTFSMEIENLNQSLQEQQVALGKTGLELIKNYDIEINRLIKQLDDKSLAPERRKNVYNTLSNLREKKSAIQGKIGIQKLEQFKLNQLTINPDDSPKKIEQKADLLKDQEEKYRKIGLQYDNQIVELKKELKLRNRIEDLVTDLALFDQQEEFGSTGSETANRTADEALTQPGIDFIANRGQSNVTVTLSGQNDFDYNSLSDTELEDVILKLESDKHNAESKADSLANQAKSFYQKAESMKKK